MINIFFNVDDIEKNLRNMSSLNTQLFKAVSERDIVKCKYLLNLGADVNVRNNTVKNDTVTCGICVWFYRYL
jgi:hypothetical protein